MIDDLPQDELVYLASPYSHPDPAMRELRFQQACKAAAYLIRRGLVLFSPIVHSHPIVLAGGLPTGWAYWRWQDELFMGVCRGLVVLTLDGWRESLGVTAEIAYMRKRGIAPEYLAMEDVE